MDVPEDAFKNAAGHNVTPEAWTTYLPSYRLLGLVVYLYSNASSTVSFPRREVLVPAASTRPLLSST